MSLVSHPWRHSCAAFEFVLQYRFRLRLHDVSFGSLLRIVRSQVTFSCGARQ